MQCTAQRQQKSANTSLLESRNLLQTATLVFPRSIVCSRLSNNINILAKIFFQAANGGRGGMAPPAPLDPPLLCGNYIQDNNYIFSESAWFCRRCDKKHSVCFGFRSSSCSLTRPEHKVLQGSVATLFTWGGKRLNYCIANLFRAMCTNFCLNQLGFVEDMIKNILVCIFFGSQCSFSHNAERQTHRWTPPKQYTASPLRWHLFH